MEQSEEWETGRVYLTIKKNQIKELNQEWIWQKGLNLGNLTKSANYFILIGGDGGNRTRVRAGG